MKLIDKNQTTTNKFGNKGFNLDVMTSYYPYKNIKTLNIFDKKSKKSYKTDIARSNIENNKENPDRGTLNLNFVRNIKHYPPAIKEWLNSTYMYSNLNKGFPVLDMMVSKLIRGYFNLYNNKIRTKIRKHRSRRYEIRRARRFLNRILLSRAELKHSNDRVVVTLYVYNIVQKYLMNKIKNIPAIFKLKSGSSDKAKGTLVKEINKAKLYMTNKTSKASAHIKYKLNNKKKGFYLLNKAKNIEANIERYQKSYLKSYSRKFLRKEIIALFYKQILIFNKSKFEKKYILLLASQICKIYTKKVEFNFVNIKHLYLDSYIFSNALIIKMKKLAKMKKSFLKGVKRFLSMFKVPHINSLDVHNEIYKRKFVNQNVNIDNVSPLCSSVYSDNRYLSYNFSDELLNKVAKPDILDNLVEITSKTKPKGFTLSRTLDIVNYILTMAQAFKSTKYKIINGVRLEIAGRFTKSSSAARSVFKIRNKGSIKNKVSSEKGLPAAILKGYSKSNLQYNFLYSKVRGGSFGIKGWLSGV